ncbi:MAG TPA: ABC transporter permease [Firmicutes bacterium]|nr:ABC transporter permease [Bacillota bacterium]
MSDFSIGKQYAFVIQQLTSREIKRKYARSYLGILWSVLNPLLSMAVLSLIFSQLFRRSIENYPIYYLTGYILWQMFTGATTAAISTLVDNKPLLLKVKFPMELFVLTRAYTALVNFLYSAAAYVVMLLVFQITPKWTMLFSPVIILLLFLFSLGLSYLLAAAYVFFGDIRHLYSVFLTLWMYCSAIFYPVEQLEGVIRVIILCNPLYAYIHSLRGVVMEGVLPGGWELAQMFMWGIGMMAAGMFIFRRSKNKIIQKL